MSALSAPVMRCYDSLHGMIRVIVAHKIILHPLYFNTLLFLFLSVHVHVKELAPPFTFSPGRALVNVKKLCRSPTTGNRCKLCSFVFLSSLAQLPFAKWCPWFLPWQFPSPHTPWQTAGQQANWRTPCSEDRSFSIPLIVPHSYELSY